MEPTRAPELNPAALPPDTKVGSWRVLSRRSRGTYGAIYRAVSVGEEEGGHVALKLALHPRDPRFEREAELLLRISHPGVPVLLDRGTWRAQGRGLFPYLVMPWVEGEPLYEWASAHHPTSREVLRLAAQLARVLEVLHQRGCLHRDVKGDNVLVGPDGQAFLVDFGAGTWAGAVRLTDDILPPGTPEYRSPEALRFQERFRGQPGVFYQARVADDLYALGVTLHRVVTGLYPSEALAREPQKERGSAAEQKGTSTRSFDSRVAPEMGKLIEVLLSETPEERGSAREVAQKAESAVERAGPEADVTLRTVPPESASPVEEEKKAEDIPAQRVRATLQAQATKWLPWLATAAMGLYLLVNEHGEPELEEPRAAPAQVAGSDKGDGGVVALGSTAVESPVAAGRPGRREPIALDLPKEPFPGQLRPDANGRCGSKLQVAINGGCWLQIVADADTCGTDGYVYKGKCYTPVFPPIRPPTSSPP